MVVRWPLASFVPSYERTLGPALDYATSYTTWYTVSVTLSIRSAGRHLLQDERRTLGYEDSSSVSVGKWRHATCSQHQLSLGSLHYAALAFPLEVLADEEQESQAQPEPGRHPRLYSYSDINDVEGLRGPNEGRLGRRRRGAVSPN